MASTHIGQILNEQDFMAQSIALEEAAKALFAGKPHIVTGAVLASLTALWLKCVSVKGDPKATEKMRAELLANQDRSTLDHLQGVEQMTPLTRLLRASIRQRRETHLSTAKSAVIKTEELPRACGHVATFRHFEIDPYRDKRREKHLKGNCDACGQEANRKHNEQQERAAAEKKAALTKNRLRNEMRATRAKMAATLMVPFVLASKGVADYALAAQRSVEATDILIAELDRTAQGDSHGSAIARHDKND